MTEPRYQKLPGRRRGFIKGSSVWLGPDHLLSVKNLRVREDYKRFYFRDVQAVAVARAPRFHISTTHFLVIVLWLIAYAALRLVPPFAGILWAVGGLIAIAWVLISARFSCRCRIYTAVSRDELPSIYRTWTAKKFLAKITPRIADVQGPVAANWAETLEAAPTSAPAPLAALLPEAILHPDAKLHTFIADLLVASLFASAIADFFTLPWSQALFGLLLLAESIALIVEHYLGRLKAPMQRLAIGNLIVIGVMYYARQMIGSFRAGITQTGNDIRIPTFFPGDALTRHVDAGACTVMGLIGLAIIFFHKD